jgi:isopenicillin N synthase-like dioxygenase
MAHAVPVIDISDIGVAGSPGPGRARAAAELDEALRTLGFVQFAGHGVPEDLIGRMQDVTAAFFALPAEAKRRWLPPDPSVNRGYAARGTEALSYGLGADSPPDLFEAFNYGPEDVPPDVLAHPRAVDFFPANVWPDDVPQFREVLLDYLVAVRDLAHRVTGLFATALGLDDDFFELRTSHSTDVIRVINYERRSGDPAPLERQQGMGAHTDYGIVTMLYADPVPGLEIVGPDGSWLPVVPEPGCYLANIGDLLAQWTNDRWKSNIHRVAPPGAGGALRRRSVAFFHDGDHDALVECLPTCTDADNPPRYPPVLAGDHLVGKLMGPRTLTVSEAVSTAGDRLARAEAGSPAGR